MTKIRNERERANGAQTAPDPDAAMQPFVIRPSSFVILLPSPFRPCRPRHPSRRTGPGAPRPARGPGAEVLEQPGITVSDPPDWSPVDAALDRIAGYDWLVFSSSNGVKRLLDRLVLRGGSLEQLAAVKLAAIGPGTAAELVRYGLAADVVPQEYRAESLAEALAPHAAGKRFLLARASRGRQVLPEQLTAAGGIVEQVVVYSTNDVETADPQIAAALAAGRVDWVTVTSSAIARAIVGLFGEQLRKARLASISPVTSQTLRELGHPPAAEASRVHDGRPGCRHSGMRQFSAALTRIIHCRQRPSVALGRCRRDGTARSPFPTVARNPFPKVGLKTLYLRGTPRGHQRFRASKNSISG